MPHRSRSSHHVRPHISRAALVNLALVGLVLYILIPAFGGLEQTLHVLQRADAKFIGAAIFVIMVNFGVAALIYVLLAPCSIRFRPTLCVQLAGGFVNRLLPAGLGNLGLNALYLMRQGHSAGAAGAVVATNNVLGVLGNVLLVTAALVFSPVSIPNIQVPQPSLLIVVGLAALGAVLFLLAQRMKRSAPLIHKALQDAVQNIHLYEQRKLRLLAALISSMLLTALHAAALYAVARALAVDLHPAQALFAVSIGAFVGAAVPTPGGLGGAEAGIVATLVAYGVPYHLALPVALGYRLITFWLPLIPGMIMLRIVEKKYL